MTDIRDISNMTDDEIGHLAYIINSPSWQGFFEPMLREMVNSIHALLLDPSQARKDQRPDDFLRGQAVTIRNFLEMPNVVIEEARMRTAQQQRDEKITVTWRDSATGGMMPLGFTEVDASEY